MNPGDIAYVNFPFSAQEIQPYKRRPVLILGMVHEAGASTILCAMITSSERRLTRPLPSDVVIDDFAACGLPKRSVVRAHRLWTAEGRDFIVRLPDGRQAERVLGTVRPGILEATRSAARALLS